MFCSPPLHARSTNRGTVAQSIKHAPRPEVRGCTARRADSRYRARPGSARAYRAWLCSHPWGRPVPAACEGVGRPRQPGVERIPQQLRRYRLVDARTRGTLSYRALHRLRVLAALAFPPVQENEAASPVDMDGPGTNAGMPRAKVHAHSIQQLGWGPLGQRIRGGIQHGFHSGKFRFAPTQ